MEQFRLRNKDATGPGLKKKTTKRTGHPKKNKPGGFSTSTSLSELASMVQAGRYGSSVVEMEAQQAPRTQRSYKVGV